jgi:hypothetical protein
VPSELEQLQHERCHAIAWQVMELFRSLLREEEALDAYAEAYAIAQQEILTYERLKAQRRELKDGGGRGQDVLATSPLMTTEV